MTERVHLLLALHGLWGMNAHIDYACRAAAKYAASRPGSDGIKLVVFTPKGNEWVNTYDGIDTCAERVVAELDDKIDEITKAGGKVERFSVLGYSLGGLVARYTLGLLASREPSFFDTVKPVNFVTFASPAIGIPAYKSFFARFVRFFGARVLSRTGRQLYGKDRFLPQSFVTGSPADKKRRFLSREPAAPLLSVLADPRYSFFKALAAFENVDVYANTVNDRTVPYPTGAIEVHDPFAAARARARSSADKRGEDPEIDVDITEGGLKLELEESAAIIKSWESIEPIVPKENIGKPRSRFAVQLPPFFYPSNLPFSRPVSIAVIATMPISLPLFLMYIVVRFSLQSRESRKRIKLARDQIGGGRQGMLSRIGVRLDDAIQQMTETMAPDNPEREIAQSSSSSSYTAVNGSPLNENSPMLKNGSAKTSRLLSKNEPRQPTDPVFTSAQLEMIENLNSIPQLKKHLVYLPQIRHTHGIIVAREMALRPAQSREPTKVYGRPIVDYWAKRFQL